MKGEAADVAIVTPAHRAAACSLEAWMGLRLSVGAACVLGLALGPGALAIAQDAPAGVKALTPSQLTYKKGPRGVARRLLG